MSTKNVKLQCINASMDDDILIGPEMEARFLYELLQ